MIDNSFNNIFYVRIFLGSLLAEILSVKENCSREITHILYLLHFKSMSVLNMWMFFRVR